MQSLHEQGVAHRDLKLENILVMSKKTLQVKLADFGLAKFELDSGFSTMCGTRSYGTWPCDSLILFGGGSELTPSHFISRT